MKLLRRSLCGLLCLVMAFTSFAGCKKTEEDSSTDKGKTDASSEFTDLSGTPNEDEFDNTTEDDATPTPGENGDGLEKEENPNYDITTDLSTGITNSGDSEDTDSEDTDSEETEDDGYTLTFPTSLIQNEEDLEYFYQGKGYVYGITADGQEIIAYEHEDGRRVDTFDGGGRFKLANVAGTPIFYYTGIESYETGYKDGSPSLTVKYNTTAGSAAIITTEYLFEDRNISVTSQVQYSGQTVAGSKSTFERTLINEFKTVTKKMNHKWVYPENGDRIYPWIESMVTVNTLDDKHMIYTFLRDENAATQYYYPDYPNLNLPINCGTSTGGLMYTMKYDLVLETTLEDPDRNVDYYALFEGQGSEFALGIAPVVTEDTNPKFAVFAGDEVTLNLNVTNLTDDDLNISLRYDVKDYNGNIVDSGLFIDSTIFYGISANRHIKIGGKYGIYYLTVYARSSYSTHLETYPFVLVEDHDYMKYAATNPFGIDAPHHSTTAETDAIVDVADKLGMKVMRPVNGPSAAYFSNLLKQDKVKVFKGMGTSIGVGSGAYRKHIESAIEGNRIWDPYYVNIANEHDKDVKFRLEESREFIRTQFLPVVFNNCKDIVENSGYKFCWNALCYSNKEFIQAMYENGIWQSQTAVDFHAYAHPKGPDSTFSRTDEYFESYGGVPVTSIERTFMRFQEVANKYGVEGKVVSLGETGYPVTDSTNLRSNSDFVVRIGAMALAYGIRSIGYYCMFDRTTYQQGFGDSQELYFGMFYAYDYYGVWKPKPWCATYAAMTKQLESVTDAYENKKYDTDDGSYLSKGTVRAMTIETAEYGDITVAWSNIYMIGKTWSDGTLIPREPSQPWESPWKQSETVSFDAVGDTVKVVDTMGNATEHKAVNGKVTLELTGSPIYIYGIK